MDARQVAIKKDPAPSALFGAGDGELCGLEPAGPARADLGGQGSTGLDGSDLRSRDLSGHAGVDLGDLGSTGLVGGELHSRDPSGPAGVDLGGRGAPGLVGGELCSRDPPGPAGVDPVLNAPGHINGVDFLGRDDVHSSHRVTHPPGTEHGGTNPTPAKPVHPIGHAEGVVVQDPAADLRPVGAGAVAGRGGPVHPPALLAILFGATIIIGEPDAPWHRQFRAFLIFLVGCVWLFLPRH